MPLAYYAQHPDQEFWFNLWAAQDFERMVWQAQHIDPGPFLAARLPKRGWVLEGGCGLGQYVAVLSSDDRRVVGGDFSLLTLEIAKQHRGNLLLTALDLTDLPFSDGSFDAYILIGVVEHLPAGPQPILVEAYRVLKPGAQLFLSVPWLNPLRRAMAGQLRAENERLRASGVPFYEYAYTTGEVRDFLCGAGFRPKQFMPYSPAKGAREFLPFLRLYRSLTTDGDSSQQSTGSERCYVRNTVRKILCKVINTRLMRRLVSHMILCEAERL